MKLPINLLLYAAIAALLGASGLQFWEALQERTRTFDQKSNRTDFERRVQAGRDTAGRVSVGPDYATDPEFWSSLHTANFTGKEPPEVREALAQQAAEEEPQQTPEVALEDIFAIVCMVFDGEGSRVVIRYKPGANVEPPPEALEAMGVATPGAGMDAVAARPPAPSGPRAGGALPVFGDGLGYTHHLKLDDTLWTYDHIRLVRVDPEARFAVFRVEKPSVAKEEWKEESMYPEALHLPQDVIRKLQEGLGIAARPDQAEESDEPALPAQPSGWMEMPETTEVAQNRYNLGTRDLERFRTDPQRIFNEDIGTATYRSRTGNVQGVKITRVPSEYSGFGVQQGDVLIAVNGQPVRSKAEGIKVGKRLYRQGVRTFEGEFLSRGQRITRTWVAPDE